MVRNKNRNQVYELIKARRKEVLQERAKKWVADEDFAFEAAAQPLANLLIDLDKTLVDRLVLTDPCQIDLDTRLTNSTKVRAHLVSFLSQKFPAFYWELLEEPWKLQCSSRPPTLWHWWKEFLCDLYHHVRGEVA